MLKILLIIISNIFDIAMTIIIWSLFWRIISNTFNKKIDNKFLKILDNIADFFMKPFNKKVLFKYKKIDLIPIILAMIFMFLNIIITNFLKSLYLGM
jgi:uncharacterized protein YggT (Ycf19 family)